MNSRKPQLDRFGVAAALQEIAQLMELKGGQYRFKAKAYNAGARAIQGVADLDRLVREDRLTTLPRIGDALASQIKQLYLTGESSVLNGLRKEFPKGIAELSAVPGLSVEKIRQLQDELGITSIAELKAAAEDRTSAKAERLWTKDRAAPVGADFKAGAKAKAASASASRVEHGGTGARLPEDDRWSGRRRALPVRCVVGKKRLTRSISWRAATSRPQLIEKFSGFR